MNIFERELLKNVNKNLGRIATALESLTDCINEEGGIKHLSVYDEGRT